MKYMTFNSSCSYAGVANMLAQYGFEIDDRTIARKMMLPYLFAKEDDAYLSGPMLQSADWFNLYLHPIGYNMLEHRVERERIPSVLCSAKTAMLGLRISPKSKHAVVYLGTDHDNYCFLNNKWQHTDEPEQFSLTEAELLSRLDDDVMVAVLEPAPCKAVDFAPLFKQSIQTLDELKQDSLSFCTQEQTPQAITAAMNTLFRAILLDGITMLELCHETNLAEKLRCVQSEFMTAVRKKTAVTLSEVLSITSLMEAIDEYQRLIQQRLSSCSTHS